MNATDLVRLATDVPADGLEADDWRVRGLAEVLVQAHLTGDLGLVAAVDRAAADVTTASPRFAVRLRGLRERIGPLATPYPAERHGPAPRAREPAPAVQEGAVRLAGFADGWLAALAPARRVAAPRLPAEPVVARAARLEPIIGEMAALRPAGWPHHCVDLAGVTGLTWRTWMLVNGRPVLAVVPFILSSDKVTQWFGIHVGTHLDHLAALVEEAGAERAAALQLGAGVLVAEAVAMAVELTVPGLVRDGAMHPGALGVWHEGIVERLARLPRLREWGPRQAPASPTMAAATAAANPEFATLPAFAAAYVAGPFDLANGGFVEPLVPSRLRRALREAWRSATPP